MEKDKSSDKKELRYFVYTTHEAYNLEQCMKRGETESVFEVITYESKVTKKLLWFLLTADISFRKVGIGCGITVFYIDKTMSFFTSPKQTDVPKK